MTGFLVFLAFGVVALLLGYASGYNHGYDVGYRIGRSSK